MDGCALTRVEYTQLAPSDNRSTKSADGRAATEVAWLNRKQFEKRRNKEKERKKQKHGRKALTLTGLLMEGVKV